VLNGSQVSITNASTVRTAQAAIFVDAGANLNVSGHVTGEGGLVKSGAGTMTLGGESSYAGQTLVQAGALAVDGTTGLGDTHIQSTGTLTGRGRIVGNLAAHAGSIIRPTSVDVNALGGTGLIDNFNDASLNEYTQYTVLNFDGAIESTFSASGGAIHASTTDSGNSPEQTAFVRPFGGLAIGQMLVVDAAINHNNGTPHPVNIFDYGLLLADSSSLQQGTRQQYLYATSRLSSSPDIMLARYWDSDPADGSPADVNVNNGVGVNIETPAATQFYIKRTAQSTYQLGYSTNNLQTLVQYGSNITVQSTFEPDLVGFYSDARGGDGVTTQTASSGTFDNLRILSPGNTLTTFTVAGDFTLDNGATLEINILSDHEYGKINVVGTLHASGTLNVQLVSGFQPTAGQIFDILDFGASNGLFETAQLPTLSPGLLWDTSKLMSEGRLDVVAGLAGDYNDDGTVDAADYIIWRKSAGAIGVGLVADGNRDLHVNQVDYDVWRAHFGQTASSGSGDTANSAVPEPATLVLLLVSATVWCLRRRRAA
jgi:autotransporter-associated beta strand protein